MKVTLLFLIGTIWRKKPHRPIQQECYGRFIQNQTLLMYNNHGDLLRLFIELNELAGSNILKKAISVLRTSWKPAREQEVEVIHVDAPSTNFHGMTAKPRVPSLWRAVDEAITAPIARPTFVRSHQHPQEYLLRGGSNSKSCEREAEQSFTHTIEWECFQPSTLLVQGDCTAAGKKEQAESRTLELIIEQL